MNVNMVLKHESSKIPTRGTDFAAGYDLYANLNITPEEFVNFSNKKGYTIKANVRDLIEPETNYKILRIPPHTAVKINTGIAMEIPEGYFGALYARSGISTRQGLRPANCVGVIDSDYRGDIIVVLRNDTDVEQTIKDCDRIAQIVFQKFEEVRFVEVDNLAETNRGDGGYGSTGR